jgi:hypothetical protein
MILIVLFELVSFAGLGYLAFYIAGKMKMFDERGVSYIVNMPRWL